MKKNFCFVDKRTQFSVLTYCCLIRRCIVLFLLFTTVFHLNAEPIIIESYSMDKVANENIQNTTKPGVYDVEVVKSFQQQRKQIKGVITDVNGESIIGANIIESGTVNGTVTDYDGNFTLEVSDNAVLNISFIGYIEQSISVEGQSSFNIILQEDTKTLEELVVVGYGTQIKRNVTGAIQSVSSEDIKNIPVSQVTQSLQGKLAGVQINQATGIPGETLQVRVRGAGSISAGSTPLYVVDGFPITGDLLNVNADEIESITILKDAASTSLYGSRAGNGVVLITTKKGTMEQLNVGLNAYYGTQTLPQKGRPDLMNGTEFAQFKKEIYEDRGQEVPDAFKNPAQYGEGYDWYDIMFRNAPIQEYNLSVTGRTERMNVAAFGGYMSQDGIMINSGYERYSFRLNSEFTVSDKILAGLNIAPTFSERYTPSTGNIFHQNNLLALALLTWPIISPVNEDGTLPITAYIPGLGGFPAPNYYRSAQEIKTTNSSTRVLSNAFLSYEPIKNLVLKTTFNMEHMFGDSKFFNPSTSSTAFALAPPVTSRAEYNSTSSVSWLSETTATYSKSIDNHSFDALLGYSIQDFKSKGLSVAANSFPDDRISDLGTATIIEKSGTDSDIQEWGLISYIGRLNYSFNNKYIVSAAIRRDGSSRFGSDNRWGNFPSASIGWIVSDEDFFPQTNTLNFLKLRASYGITGNNNIGNYTQFALVNLGNNYILGENIAAGASVGNLANPFLGWEKSKQLDLGVDINLFNNRVSFVYDYYLKNTYDLLYNFSIPNSSGFGNFQGNSGEFKFWGHELAINTRNFVGEFKWTTDFNIAFSDNKVVSLAPNVDAIYGGDHISKVGDRIGLFYGLVWDGVYVDQADYDSSAKASRSAVGTIKFKDMNEDGVILNTNTGGDRVVIGDPTPKFVFGMTNTFEYNNFDLSILVSGSVGNDIANRFETGSTNLDGPFNVLKEVKNRWRSEENPGDGRYGTTNYATGMERDWFNSRFITDGSFLSIKNVTLGYNVNVNEISFLSRLRLYFSVQQLHTFTNYRGNNPEVSNSTNVLRLGDDYASYPVPRTWTLGVNIGF